MSLALHAVTVDCRDAAALGGFWACALGGAAREAGNGYVAVDHGSGGGQHLLFQPVPEERQGKNRLHLDLSAADPAAEVERLVDLGATLVDRRSDSLFTWWVLADPEGNLFCVG
jgi:hypothetical protein